jgi:hypothetical protein
MSSLSASRAVLRCNRIQLDAIEAGPTSPVFFCAFSNFAFLFGSHNAIYKPFS